MDLSSGHDDVSSMLESHYATGASDVTVGHLSQAISVCVNPSRSLPIEQARSLAQAALGRVGLSTPQCIVLMGESGTGKSKTARQILECLAEAAPSASSSRLEEHLAAVDLLLAAFGNCSTRLSASSSRFGRLTTLCFSVHETLRACVVEQVLLEKSRVLGHRRRQGERSFHVFHQLPLANGAQPDDFTLLQQSSGATALRLPSSDAPTNSWPATLGAMEVLHFPPEHVEIVQSTLLAILHLGNITFEEGSATKSTSASSVHDDDEDDEDAVFTAEGERALQAAAALLKCPEDTLRSALTVRTITINREANNTPMNAAQASECRDVLARELYARIFAHIVAQCNAVMASSSSAEPSTPTPPGQLPAAMGDLSRSITVVDSCGLDCLIGGGVEALCLNHASDLMHHSLVALLAREAGMYALEGIEAACALQVAQAETRGAAVLAGVEGPRGWLGVLEEEARVQGSESDVMRRMDPERDPRALSAFSVQHYGACVEYSISGAVVQWLDRVPDHIEAFLRTMGSRGAFYSLPSPPNSPPVTSPPDTPQSPPTLLALSMDGGPGSAPPAALRNLAEIMTSYSRRSFASPRVVVSPSRLQAGLRLLSARLSASTRTYVLCLKPNDEIASDRWDAACVARQLGGSGLVEAVALSRGCIVKQSLLAFHQRYWMLARGVDGAAMQAAAEAAGVPDAGLAADKVRCDLIVANLDDSLRSDGGAARLGIQIGTSTAFLTLAALSRLETARDDKLAAGLGTVVRIQTSRRLVSAMRRYAVLSEARQQLRELLRLGQLRACSNVSVLSRLRDMVEFGKTLQMGCVEVRLAGGLCDRLDEVRGLVERAQIHLAASAPVLPASADGPSPSPSPSSSLNPAALSGVARYVDVVAEYEAGEALIAQAEGLKGAKPVAHLREYYGGKVTFPELDEIMSRRPVLEEKGQCLKALRQACEAFDSPAITAALARVERLNAKFGPWCAADEATGRDMLVRLARDSMLIEEVLDTLRDFHVNYDACEAAAAAAAADGSGGGSRKGLMPPALTLKQFVASAAPQTSALALGILTEFTLEPALSAESRVQVETLTLLAQSYALWAEGGWRQLGEGLQGCLEKCRDWSLGETESLWRERNRVADTSDMAVQPAAVASSRSARSEASVSSSPLHGAVSAFTRVVAADLHVQVLLPSLQAALAAGAVTHVGKKPPKPTGSSGSSGSSGAEAERPYLVPDTAVISHRALLAVLDQASRCLWLHRDVDLCLLRGEVLCRVRACFEPPSSSAALVGTNESASSSFLGIGASVAGMSPMDVVVILTETVAVSEPRASLRRALRGQTPLTSVPSYSSDLSTSAAGSDANPSTPSSSTPNASLSEADNALMNCLSFLQASAATASTDSLGISSSNSALTAAAAAVMKKVDAELAQARTLALALAAEESMQEALSAAGAVKPTPSVTATGSASNMPSWPLYTNVNALPLATLLEMLALDSSFLDGLMPTVLKRVVGWVQALREGRDMFTRGDWTAVLKAHDMGKYTAALGSSADEAPSDGVAAIAAQIKTETICLIREARNNQSIARLLDAIAKGCVSGSAGSLALVAIDVLPITHAMDAARMLCEAPKSGALPFNGMNQKLLLLLQLCKVLVSTRTAFKQPGIEPRKAALEQLDAVIPLVSQPRELAEIHFPCPSLGDEVLLMHTEVDYCECLVLLRQGLVLRSPVQYFIPVATANAAPDQESAAAAAGTASSSDSSSSFSAPASDGTLWNEIIAQENLCLNMAALDTENLSGGLVVAKRLQLELSQAQPPTVLPAEYTQTIRAAELIRTVRDSVRTGQWTEASSALASIREEGLHVAVPLIQEEILAAEPPVNNYMAVTVCKAALQTGMGRGEVGAMLYDHISLEPLETAMRTCLRAGGTKSPHAEALIKAVLAVIDIRRAQKNRDWGALKDALRRTEAAGIGAPGSLTAVCHDEICRAQLELENGEVLEGIQRAIVDEAIPTKDSLIHTGNVSTQGLQAAVNMAARLHDNKRTGTILLELLLVLEELLKLRRAANRGEEFIVSSIRKVVEDYLNVFRGVIEELAAVASGGRSRTRTFSGISEGSGTPGVNKGRRNSMRVSLQPAARSSSLEIASTSTDSASEAASLGSAGAGASGVVSADGAASLVSLESAYEETFRSLWEQFHDMDAAIRQDLLVIDQHFEVQKLEAAIKAALRSDGIEEKHVGKSDFRKVVSTAKIEACVETKLSMESRGMKLPPRLHGVFESSAIVVSLRRAMIDQAWEEADALLEKLPSVEGLHEACHAEVQLIRFDSNNRWMVDNLKRCIFEGRLRGDLGSFHLHHREVEAMLRSIEFKNLQEVAAHCVELGPRTEEARQLLYTSDALIVLRQMLLAPPAQQQRTPSLIPFFPSPDDVPQEAPQEESTGGINWRAILDKTRDLLQPKMSNHIHPTCLPELKLFQASAEDCLLCDAMRAALLRGGPSGTPGLMDVQTVDVEELSEVMEEAMRNPPKTIVAAQLLNACRDILAVRGHVKRTRHEDPKIVTEAHQQVRRFVDKRIQEERNIQEHEAASLALRIAETQTGGDVTMGAGSLRGSVQQLEVTSNQLGTAGSTDIYPHGWYYCGTEMLLLAKDANIAEISRMLTETIEAAGPAYVLRSRVSLEQINGVEGLALPPPEATDLPLQPLQTAIDYATKLSFVEPVKESLVNACDKLLRVRKALMEADWPVLEAMGGDTSATSAYNTLSMLPYPVGALATKEFTLAMSELTSHKVAEIIRTALNQSSELLSRSTLESWEAAIGEPVGASGSSSSNSSSSSGGGGSGGYDGPPYQAAQRLLQEAISKCENLGGGLSHAAEQWVELAVHVQLLRTGLAAQNSKRLERAMAWFKSNESGLVQCAGDEIQREAKEAKEVHTNNLLETGLTNALQTGKPTGSRGYVDASTIETHDLELFLRAARAFKEKNPAVQALSEAGEIILTLRKAIQLRDMSGVHASLAALQARGPAVLPLILDEVAIARCELDDEVTVSALACAIGAFDSFSDARCRDALQRRNNLEIVGNAKFNRRYKEVSSPSPDLYSFSNCSPEEAGEIDPATIDTDILDEALDIAHMRGLYTAESKKLLKTARLLRQLRGAMKTESWEGVQDLLVQANILTYTMGVGSVREGGVGSATGNGPQARPPVAAPLLVVTSSLRSLVDRCAEREIVVIASQLQLRSAMVGVSKCLKTGQATVSIGIVDTTRLDCDNLHAAIEAAKRHLPDHDDNEDDAAASSSSSSLSSPSARPSASSARKGPAKVKHESKLHTQMQHLLSSAETVLMARRALKQKPMDLQGCSDIAHRALFGDDAQADGSRGGGGAGRGQTAEERRVSGAVTIYPGMQAASPPDKPLLNSLHRDTRAELLLYSTELAQALRLCEVCRNLQQFASGGEPALLAQELRAGSAGDLGAAASVDLGLTRVLQRAHDHLGTFVAAQAKLRRALRSYEVPEVEAALRAARAAGLAKGPLFQAVEARAAELAAFEKSVQAIKSRLGGALTDTEAMFEVLAAATSSPVPGGGASHSDDPARSGPLASAPMLQHPLSVEARTCALLSPRALRTVLLAQACRHNLPYVAATETMRAKRQYLSQPGVSGLFDLDSFPALRSVASAAELVRGGSTVTTSTSSRGSIYGSAANVSGLTAPPPDLLHSSACIPVSLTTQPPWRSALAVWIFAHCVQGIEMEIYTKPEVHTRLAIRCGQACPELRDEVLLQIIKQIRDNPESSGQGRAMGAGAGGERAAGRVARLWVLLCTCLRHFPPSAAFENYLELFLYKNIRTAEMHHDPITHVPARNTKSAIRSPRGALGPSGWGVGGGANPGPSLGSFDRTQLAKLAIRLMHEAIFTFGYGVPIDANGLENMVDPATPAADGVVSAAAGAAPGAVGAAGGVGDASVAAHAPLPAMLDLSLAAYRQTAWLGPARPALDNISALVVLQPQPASGSSGSSISSSISSGGGGSGIPGGGKGGKSDLPTLTALSFLYDPGYSEPGARIRPPEAAPAEEPKRVRRRSAAPGYSDISMVLGNVVDDAELALRHGKRERETLTDSLLQAQQAKDAAQTAAAGSGGTPRDRGDDEEAAGPQARAVRGSWADWVHRFASLATEEIAHSADGASGSHRGSISVSSIFPVTVSGAPPLRKADFVHLLVRLMDAPLYDLSLDQQALCYEVCLRQLRSHWAAVWETSGAHPGSYLYTFLHEASGDDTVPPSLVGGTGGEASGEEKQREGQERKRARERERGEGLREARLLERLSYARQAYLEAIHAGAAAKAAAAASVSDDAQEGHAEEEPRARHAKSPHRSQGGKSPRDVGASSIASTTSTSGSQRSHSRSPSGRSASSPRHATLSAPVPSGVMDSERVRVLAAGYWDRVVLPLLELTRLVQAGSAAGYEGFDPRHVEPSYVSVFPAGKAAAAVAAVGRGSPRPGDAPHGPHPPRASAESNSLALALPQPDSPIIRSGDGLTHPVLRDIVLTALRRAVQLWVEGGGRGHLLSGAVLTSGGRSRAKRDSYSRSQRSGLGGLFQAEEDLDDFDMRRRDEEE